MSDIILTQKEAKKKAGYLGNSYFYFNYIKM